MMSFLRKLARRKAPPSMPGPSSQESTTALTSNDITMHGCLAELPSTEGNNLRSQQRFVGPVAVATSTIVYIPEESPGTISAMCTTEISSTTMEPRLCLRKAWRSNGETKMLDAEEQHGSRPKKDLKKRRGLQVNTSGENSYRHYDLMSWTLGKPLSV